MPVHDLKDQLARLPEQPGVYLWVNAAGETIYVGKARSLRDRVRSYLGAYGLSPRHDALLDEIARVEVIVTDSVMEALVLETNLIKQRSPRYNILLRDDKNYPYLRLTTSEAFPRILVARSVEKTGDFYAGPFLPAKLARRTMTLSHRVFGIRSCNEVITGMRGRPCLEYDIKRCLAPVRGGNLHRRADGVAVANTRLLLEGRNDELIERLRDGMQSAADEAIRGGGAAARCLADRADASRPAAEGRERWAWRSRRVRTEGRTERWRDSGLSSARAARRRTRRARDRSWRDRRREADVLHAALMQFYELRVPAWRSICRPRSRTLRRWRNCSRSRGRKVRILVPQRGDKRALVELATRNAELSYRTRFNETTAAHFDALETLRSRLNLPAIPRRIDCFDISTIQGSETVASMVVCEDGRMKRREYRKFRVRGLGFSVAAPGPRSSPEPESRVPDPRRFRGHARGRAAAVSRGARSRRAISRI